MKLIFYRLAHLFGVAEETFLRITSQIMDAFLLRIHQIIAWPTPNQLRIYSRQFDAIGRYDISHLVHVSVHLPYVIFNRTNIVH